MAIVILKCFQTRGMLDQSWQIFYENKTQNLLKDRMPRDLISQTI